MRKLAVITFLLATGIGVSAVALPVQASDAAIPTMVERIFANRPAENFVSVVLRDPANRQYVAFHISTYLDIKELRVYVIPFVGANAEGIDADLAAGDHESAFEKVLTDMRIDLGARYVADVALDGIRDADVPLGQGRMRDNFHRDHFSSFEAANEAYLSWLRRGVELLSS